MYNYKFLLVFAFYVLTLEINGVVSIRTCAQLSSYDNPFATDCYNDPNGERNISQIMQSWGFSVSEYRLTTIDGYIITLVRGYNPSVQPRVQTPLIFATGFLSNADNWVIKGNRSLHYRLGNLGWDIWSVNWRGTKPSRQHVTYNTKQLAFWNFTFYDMAMGDLPVVLETVYNVTRQKAVFIGNSMGSAVALALASDRPNYFDTFVKGNIALAPTAILGNLMGSLKAFIAGLPAIVVLTDATSAGEFAGILATNIPHDTIAQSGVAMIAVQELMFSAFGFDNDQIDPLSISVGTSIGTDSAAIKNMNHFGQLVTSRQFQQYDYGTKGNQLQYGQDTPPLINLGGITCPTTIFTALNDYAVQIQDAQSLYSRLRLTSRCGFNIVPYPYFNHVDYIVAKDVNTIFNNQLIQVLNGYNMGICVTL